LPPPNDDGLLGARDGEVGGVTGCWGLRFGIFSGIVRPVLMTLIEEEDVGADDGEGANDDDDAKWFIGLIGLIGFVVFGEPGMTGVVRPICTGVLRPGFEPRCARLICGLCSGVVGRDPSPLV
jgi:hypothetical protein